MWFSVGRLWFFGSEIHSLLIIRFLCFSFFPFPAFFHLFSFVCRNPSTRFSKYLCFDRSSIFLSPALVQVTLSHSPLLRFNSNFSRQHHLNLSLRSVLSILLFSPLGSMAMSSSIAIWSAILTLNHRLQSNPPLFGPFLVFLAFLASFLLFFFNFRWSRFGCRSFLFSSVSQSASRPASDSVFVWLWFFFFNLIFQLTWSPGFIFLSNCVLFPLPNILSHAKSRPEMEEMPCVLFSTTIFLIFLLLSPWPLCVYISFFLFFRVTNVVCFD